MRKRLQHVLMGQSSGLDRTANSPRFRIPARPTSGRTQRRLCRYDSTILSGSAAARLCVCAAAFLAVILGGGAPVSNAFPGDVVPGLTPRRVSGEPLLCPFLADFSPRGLIFQAFRGGMPVARARGNGHGGVIADVASVKHDSVS